VSATPAEPAGLASVRVRAGEIADLHGIGGLLLWDQNTMMPRGAAGARADQFGALERLLHDKVTDPELSRLLEGLEPWAASEDPDSDDVRLLARLRRDHHKAVRVPTSLAAELSTAGALAQEAWHNARDAADWELFRPSLEHVLELSQRYVSCFDGSGDFAHPYDVLLDDYEPGLKTAELKTLFAGLSAELVPLVAATAGPHRPGGVFPGSHPQAAQSVLMHEILTKLGFESEHWRLDASVHPFARSMAHTDVRLTTRWEEDDLGMAFYSCLHEFGHGLYEAQMGARLYRTTLADASGLGMHESQSRMWENLVGRSRAFCEWVLPRLRAQLGGPFEMLGSEDLYRAVNRVQPSLIRIEADETTYNLHIALRFELELALVEGRLSAAELPDAWDEAVGRLLGLEVPGVNEGVLQDIHWGAGMFGYFPTYTLGNLMAAQLWEALCRDVPAIEEDIAAGRFAPLREWLGEHIHRHGRKFDSSELLLRATGEELRVEPWIGYLERKLLDTGLMSAPVRGRAAG
jgi:carboxypeptidase Taq